MAGEELPPYEVFLKALDIVAAGPRLDPAARRDSARRAQSHADRLQAAANRVRESAQRMQSSAELAQAQAALLRKKAERADPQAPPGSSARCSPRTARRPPTGRRKTRKTRRKVKLATPCKSPRKNGCCGCMSPGAAGSPPAPKPTWSACAGNTSKGA